MLELRPYQTESLAAIDEAVARGITRPLLALPTGTGKTVVFAHLVARRPGRTLILVHREELVWQAYDKLTQIAPDVRVGIVKAERDETDASCVIASVQTVSRKRRLEHFPAEFATVIVDEAHHSVAASYRRVLTHVGSFAPDGPLTLGVTATPQRGDAVGLSAVFQEIVYQKSLLEMIQAGYLCDLSALQIQLQADLNHVHMRGGDFREGELETLLFHAEAPQHVAQAYLTHARGRKALLFTPTVAVAYAMAETFRQLGVAAEALEGSTPPDERRAILQRLHTGQTQVVANCAVLTEGFDEPSIDCILIARPTRSQALFTQMVGRGTRGYPGKTNCLVLDLVGNTTCQGLASVATLVGLPLEALQTGRSVTEAAVAVRAEEAARAELAGEILAASVDLFEARPLHWLNAGAGFVLSLGDAGWLRLAVTLSPQGEEEWEATRITRQGDQRVLGCEFSLAYAQGIAEDYARRRGATHLVNRQAEWRQKAASERQKWLLDQLDVSFAHDLSSGEAADLISVAKLDEVLQRGDSDDTRVTQSNGPGPTPRVSSAPAVRPARSRDESPSEPLSLLGPQRVETFYRGLGQSVVSRYKVDKGEDVLRTLEAQGFTPQQLAWGMEWILREQGRFKNGVYSLGLLPKVIHQALRESASE